MSQAVSIHIGVNEPRSASAADVRAPLPSSEAAAWRMAELASQAGYGSILLLRGRMATLAAVNAALWNASQLLAGGDTLLVTFSGHGGRVRDLDGEDRDGSDESWSLADGELLDDTLCGYWRLFRAGVRIVVVSESCYAGGMMRSANEDELRRLPLTEPSRRLRDGRMPAAEEFSLGVGSERVGKRGEPGWSPVEMAKTKGPAPVEPPRDASGVRATVLMLTATSEKKVAQAGLFTDCLLEVWAGGTCSHSYSELIDEVKARVMRIKSDQEPQIMMLGTRDPEFSRLPAFRPRSGPRPENPATRYRDGGSRTRGG